MIEIIAATREPYVSAVRALFEAFGVLPEVDVGCLGDYRAEIDGLPGAYAPPTGVLLLAEADGEAAGCVALRRLDAETAEMKRFYVAPAFRRHGIGRRLVVALLAQAEALGYRRVYLETLPAMVAARALYAAFGFRELGPLHTPHVANAICMQVELGKQQAERKDPGDFAESLS